MRAPPVPADSASRLADGLRVSLARHTRRGIGMTLATCAYWAGLAAVVAWAGLSPRALALFFLVATALVYPLGWALDRACRGDLLARGHPLARLVWVLGATQALGWPMLGLVVAQAPTLLSFALAALLGAHFLPYGWLYRSPSYYALGIGSVLLSALLQWRWPERANLAIPLAMAACYALAAFGVWRENRRDARAPRAC
ncbi:MAG: DUF7010 family protein [Lysobacteraceae bacterium]